MRLIDHIRAAIELHDDTETRIQYVLERYDAKRDFSVPGGDVDTQSVNKKNRAKKTAADHQFGGSTFDLIFEATLLAIFVVLCAAILASFWL